MLYSVDSVEEILLAVIDVLAVSIVFYKIYTLFSRTRAVQLLIGFGLILLADVFAQKLELRTISWLITNVTSYLVIGLIVLLQPELRRLVYEMGRMPIFQRFSTLPEVPVDEIVVAVKEMAHAKVGSIIVILRETRAPTVVENSVTLNATVTHELLETIFFKDTPLHDGAVLIQGNRIISAACFLPMSSALNIKKTYGARHRAALGFSEESDAIIIVTSEETGKITVMKNGEMQNVRGTLLIPLLQELLKNKGLKDSLNKVKGVESDVA